MSCQQAGDVTQRCVHEKGSAVACIGQTCNARAVWVPAAQVLEGYDSGEWVCFERALVVRDIFTGGVRTFLSKADARAFRSLIYAQYGELEPCCRRRSVINFVRPKN